MNGCWMIAKMEHLLQHGPANRFVKIGSGSSVSGDILYKKGLLAVLRKQMTMGLAQDVFFSTQTATIQVGHPAAAPRWQDTMRRVQERVVGSARRELWWNTKSGDLPGSFAGWVRTYLDETATTLKFLALVAYPVHVV